MTIAGTPWFREPHLWNHENVGVDLCPISFYNQVCPSDSVVLGFSASALHWLSKKPEKFLLSDKHSVETHAIHSNLLNSSFELRQQMQQQAQSDWLQILQLRSKELADGGRLLLIVFAEDVSTGHFLGNTGNGTTSMLKMLDHTWREMMQEGILTKQEYQSTHFCNYYRTVEELQLPFQQGCLDELSLVSITLETVPCPFHQKRMSTGMDGRAYAKWYVPTIKTWSFSTFLGGLASSRTAQEKQDIVNELFNRFGNDEYLLMNYTKGLRTWLQLNQKITRWIMFTHICTSKRK